MRSHEELEELCATNGISSYGLSSRQMMDALREAIGTFDPDLQIDPMKAMDLKSQINWAADTPEEQFKKITASHLNDDWVADVKLDGARMRLFLGDSSNTMNTGRRSVKTFAYIERADNFPHIKHLIVPTLSGTILDGEMMPPSNSIVLSDGSKTQGPLNSVMAMVNSSPDKSITLQKTNGPAIFVAFDVMAYNGDSTIDLPYEERRELLELIIGTLNETFDEQTDDPIMVKMGATVNPVQLVPSMAATPHAIQAALDAGFEGVILKKKDSVYEPGKRPKTWCKIKHMSTGDFYIVGSVDGNGKNAGKVGSLKVAYYDGTDSVYVADVGGFTDAFRDELTDPTTGQVSDEWLNKVIEVQAQGRTRHNRLRHPMFKRVRPDKDWSDCDSASSIDLFELV